MAGYEFDSRTSEMTSADGTGGSPPEPEERRGWIYAMVGCGGCLLLCLCTVPPAAWFMLDEEEFGGDLGDLEWLEPTDPAELEPIPEGPPPPEGGGEPRAVVARVTEVSGLTRVDEGSQCSFSVYRHPREDGTFWCNVQVVCEEVLLYGGENAGFFDCTLYEQPERHVVGEDPNTTETDRDAAMRIDTISQELVVEDDASGRLGEFRVVATIESIE